MTLCHYAECRDLFIGMLNVIVLSVVMLSVVANPEGPNYISRLLDFLV